MCAKRSVFSSLVYSIHGSEGEKGPRKKTFLASVAFSIMKPVPGLFSYNELCFKKYTRFRFNLMAS